MIDSENHILDEIFERLVQNDEITDNDVIEVFEHHNTYILSVNDRDLRQEAEKKYL